MTATISSWVAHSTREPGQALLNAMDAWWTDMPTADDERSKCPWLMSSMHRLLLVHVDRAAHKRRHVPTFMCRSACGCSDHGPSPIATMLRDDVYDTMPIDIEHSTGPTALGSAIESVKGADARLAVAMIGEGQFDNPDNFDLHRSALVKPGSDGVALAVIHVAATGKETLDDEMEREDLLRAAGWATYLLDMRKEEDSAQLHRRLASYMEDVFDEIAQIKADSAARALMSDPLWPAIVIRTSPEWRELHNASIDLLVDDASA